MYVDSSSCIWHWLYHTITFVCSFQVRVNMYPRLIFFHSSCRLCSHWLTLELILRGGGWFLICVAICSSLCERIFTMVVLHRGVQVDKLIELDVMYDFHVFPPNIFYESKRAYLCMDVCNRIIHCESLIILITDVRVYEHTFEKLKI